MSLFDDLIPEQKQQPKQQLSEGPLSRFVAGTLAFGQGGMPLFDEAGAWLGEKLGTGGDIPYEKRLENIRNLESAFTEEYPKTDLGLRVGGAVGATIPFAGAMAARPIASGAAYGAAQGFSGSDGGASNRLFGGTVGAGLGAGGAYAVDRVLVPAASYAAQRLGFSKPPSLSLKGKEIENIKKNVALGGLTPQQYAANLLRSTEDDFAGELGGEALRMQTQTQAKFMGPNMQATREAMRQRLKDAPIRVGNIIDESLGSADDAAKLLANVDEMRTAEDSLYKAAQGSIPTREVADIINRPAGQQAVKDANINMLNRYGSGLDDGFVKGQSMPLDLTIKQAHEISKSLGGQIKRNPLTGAIEDPAQGGPIEGMREAIVSKLRGSSPEFDLAQTNAANIRQAEEALSRGRKLAGMSTGERADDVLAAAIKKEEVIPYTKAGFRQGLFDAIENVPLETGNPAARIASQKTVNRISELVGPEVGESFSKKIVAEKLRMDLANRGLYGSNTAETLGAGLSNIPTSRVQATEKVISFIDDLVNSKSRERFASALLARTSDEKEELARLLLGPNAESFVPSLTKRNEIIEMLRGVVPSIPAQVGGAVSNVPTVRIYKKDGE